MFENISQNDKNQATKQLPINKYGIYACSYHVSLQGGLQHFRMYSNIYNQFLNVIIDPSHKNGLYIVVI